MVNLLAGASDVDTNDVLSAVTLTYRVDSTPTGVSGTQLPAGVSLSGSPSTLSLSVDPTDAAFDNLAAGQPRLIVASYDVSDGLDTVAQTVTITISGTNDVPAVASALTLARNEGQVYTDGTNTVNLLAGASDVDKERKQRQERK